MSLGGVERVTVWRVDQGIDLVFEGLQDLDVVRQCEHMVNHLRRGGLIGFSADHDKTLAAIHTGGPIEPGSDLTGVPFVGGFWYNWQTAPSLTGSTDVVAVESLSRGMHERHTVSTVSNYESWGVLLTLDGNVQFPQASPVLVREQYTFPALRLRAGERSSPSLLTSRSEHTWRLALPLVEDIGALSDVGAILPGTNGLPVTLAGTPYAPPR